MSEDVHLNLTTDLPISYALGVHLDEQVNHLRNNPVSSHTQVQSRSIGVIFPTLYAAVNAVQTLEVEVRELRARAGLERGDL